MTYGGDAGRVSGKKMRNVGMRRLGRSDGLTNCLRQAEIVTAFLTLVSRDASWRSTNGGSSTWLSLASTASPTVRQLQLLRGRHLLNLQKLQNQKGKAEMNLILVNPR